MKQTKIIMGMPITLEICDKWVSSDDFKTAFDYFRHIDKTFSTYQKNSEISRINNLKLKIEDASKDIKTIFRLAEKTKKQTNGFFDIYYQGKYDPSGIVKGWAIYHVYQMLKKQGLQNFYIDAGGDIQTMGNPSTSSEYKNRKWKIGIKNPFNQNEIIKVIYLSNKGIATSGNYIRGEHIYNPKKDKLTDEAVSLTVIGPNVYDADRFATAAFAMGKDGINFINSLKGLEGYMIDKVGIATYTVGFEKYTEC